jgi:single-strand DNA-binding protein
MENLAIVIGNLGADPELRHTKGGKAVVGFSVATTDKWKDRQTGKIKEYTEWHQVEAWEDLAKACAEHLEKGSLVYVRGRLQKTCWEPKPGVKSYNTVISAKKVKFL